MIGVNLLPSKLKFSPTIQPLRIILLDRESLILVSTTGILLKVSVGISTSSVWQTNASTLALERVAVAP